MTSRWQIRAVWFGLVVFTGACWYGLLVGVIAFWQHVIAPAPFAWFVAAMVFAIGACVFRIAHLGRLESEAREALLDRAYGIEKRRENFWADSVR